MVGMVGVDIYMYVVDILLELMSAPTKSSMDQNLVMRSWSSSSEEMLRSMAISTWASRFTTQFCGGTGGRCDASTE